MCIQLHISYQIYCTRAICNILLAFKHSRRVTSQQNVGSMQLSTQIV